MRNIVSLPTWLLVLLFSPLVLAQTSSTPDGLPCPRCQSRQERAAARQKYDVD
jgi:hypothetical protein